MLFVFIFLGFVLVISAVSMVFLNNQEKSKGKSRKKSKTPVGTVKKGSMVKQSTWLKWYDKTDRFFLTRKELRVIFKQLQQLSIYNSQELRVKTIQVFISVYVTALSVLLVSVIAFKDTFVVLIMVLAIILVKDILINKQVDKLHFMVMKELLVALSNLRQSYLRLNSISDALAETEVHPMLRRPFEEIHVILTSDNGDKRLQEFYNTTPFKLLRTLASICYKLDSAGDTKLQNGSTSFLLSISMLSTEAQMEVRRLTNQKLTFGMLEYIPVAPIVAVPAIEAFFSSVVPGTAIVYNGFMGYMFKIIVIVSCIVGYMTVSRINSVTPIKKDDRTKLSIRLATDKRTKQFIANVTPKSLKRVVKANMTLRSALSAKELKHLYGDKIIFSTGAFVLMVVVIIFGIILGREFTYGSMEELSMMPADPLPAEEYDKKKNMDGRFLAEPALPDYDFSYNLIKEYFPRYSQLAIEDEISRLTLKYNNYHNTYFKWWHLLLCCIVSIIAWTFPNFILKFRKNIARTEAEEDVLQLQTVISILTTTTADTLETLEWMMKQSEIHKNLLIDCYHEYPSNPEMSLNKLKAKVSVVEFKRIIDKLLLTIHQMSLQEAFSDLIEEREHSMRIREMTQDTTLKKKRAMCKPISMIPLAAVVVLYFLVPLGYLGYTEFIGAMSQMNS